MTESVINIFVKNLHTAVNKILLNMEIIEFKKNVHHSLQKFDENRRVGRIGRSADF